MQAEQGRRGWEVRGDRDRERVRKRLKTGGIDRDSIVSSTALSSEGPSSPQNKEEGLGL